MTTSAVKYFTLQSLSHVSRPTSHLSYPSTTLSSRFVPYVT